MFAQSFSLAPRLLRFVDQKTALLAPLLARSIVGYAFFHSGSAKLSHLDKVEVFFASLGIPAPGFHAVFVSSIELVCGSLLLLGLLTRLAAIPLIGTMIVAIATAKWSEVSDLNDFVGLIEVTYVALLVWLAHAGGGSVSIDSLLVGPTSRLLPTALFRPDLVRAGSSPTDPPSEHVEQERKLAS